MFKSLLKLSNLNKSQLKRAESLSEKFSENNKAHLEKANNLLFEFWYSENMPTVQIMLDVLTTIEFKGNFNLWTFIEPSYTLKYYLTEDIAIKEGIRTMLIEEVKSKLESNEEHILYLEKVRNGLLVDMSKESMEKSSSLEDRYLEYGYRTTLLIRYLHLFTLGATGSISEEDCLNGIHSNYSRLQYLYNELKK